MPRFSVNNDLLNITLSNIDHQYTFTVLLGLIENRDVHCTAPVTCKRSICADVFVCANVCVWPDVCVCTCRRLFVCLCGLTFMPAHCILSSVQLEPIYHGIHQKDLTHHLCLSPREPLNYCSSITEHRQPEQSTFADI